jgi:hypothetical protein
MCGLVHREHREAGNISLPTLPGFLYSPNARNWPAVCKP